MALNVLLEILRILRFARDCIKQFPGGASLLALLGRKLTAWWRFWHGNLGSYHDGGQKPVKRPFIGTEASSYSVSGGSAVVGCVVAASYVPPSASRLSLVHERTDGQQQLTTVEHPVGTHPPVIASLSRNLSAASIQSRASERFSIITTSRYSIRTTHGQPPRLPRAIHRQFGRGPDPLRTRERPTRPSSRPNTPSTRPHIAPSAPRFEIITTTLPSAAHRTSNEVRRGQSSTSFVVDIQSPSAESIPITPSTTNPITDDPHAMESATAHSSPDSPVVVQHDGPVPGSPTPFNAATLYDDLPEGRFVQLINSDQIPRYTKDAFMQVEYTILSPYPYISLQTSHGDNL
jgi:hypothetical protein